ncbi:hypothetical protein L3Y34_016028 [Caenorhabditis briggsae]|uniref:Uncharacterized protein n=2 Tax=Caenorhabditis briggsae TaxID=6238 RepID=A0AAE9DX32_CAEBR|nr:hypothetical protein L3Y34_016027 [Caenorhabditis briggsae]ULU13245.1 hypothetical protein L3Y34_016028 [Caenorhabditis briggsae]
MDPEPLRFLRPIDSEDQSTIDTEGEDTSSILSDGVPYRMNNTDLNEERIDESCIDNNDNQGTFDQIFISVEVISNCQEESEIQLEDSSTDNNSNISTGNE